MKNGGEISMRQNGLEGRVGLVTGAGRGLGEAIAMELALSGAQTILVSRTQEELESVSTEIQDAGLLTPSVLQADLEDLDSLSALAKTLWDLHGRIDIAVYAAGRQLRQPATAFSVKEVTQILELNLISPFILGSAIGSFMIDHRVEGRHIFIGSLSSSIGLPNVVPYGASKSGVVGVVRGLAREWAEHSITVNAVLPGYIETALTRPLLADPERRSQILARIPMGRLGLPEDIAGACGYLASDAAAYVTGQTIAVDGGWLAS